MGKNSIGSDTLELALAETKRLFHCKPNALLKLGTYDGCDLTTEEIQLSSTIFAELT